ncbi:MAG: 23S rRNA pseudouridine(1911/1915/1917) synthase RluD [Zoogloeaceae bacterium]|jgi:23S rRNA pseudouridine1911/1915/1917 synthase|nr:23S rRNA pseudouridine(1911/1915/1917) synthase RluD [Zoogloeaceae bacterium]
MEHSKENPEDYKAPARQILTCPPEAAGQRLDQTLARLLPQYSRSRLQAWIKDGQTQIDGITTQDARKKMRGGEILTLFFPSEPEERSLADAPEDIALDILFADAELFILNKPAGLVVHPGNGNRNGTLLNALLHHDPRLAAIPRSGIVHRLDKETSGLMAVARTLTAQASLVRQLQARSVRREYLAVALGEITRDGVIDAPIGRHRQARTRMAVTSAGKPAITRYQVVRRYRGATLLACQLETGRTHQIRVHMAHLGHPLLGDPLYGRGRAAPPGLPAFSRQALHALRLTLRHPASGEEMRWEAPPPEDMTNLLAALAAQVSP